MITHSEKCKITEALLDYQLFLEFLYNDVPEVNLNLQCFLGHLFFGL